ncbi:DUF3825 domain-containing protein [Amycolatopsis taiwanensis]|uniref:DUF3825 domain-containing protein n=1 Tax=Amycolatopsis taiwanensis TaxID=342230 RepID=UPI0004B05CD6|nr:DUF3825 domain-containing protein [Amycolatopsis taiwanensis]
MTNENHPADPTRVKQRIGGTTSLPGAPVSRQPSPSDNALYEYAHMRYVRSNANLREGTGEPDLFDHLANLAEPENWNGREATTPGSNRILRNYIRWTFERAHQQGKISTSTDGAHSAFNTGLATARQETIYGLFRRNDRTGSQPWVFVDWRLESKRDFMEHFPPSQRPEFVTYTENPADYIYDWRRELVVSVDHILDDQGNLARFPIPLQESPHLARMALTGAVDGAKDRVRRNYKAAVPMWYPAQDTVQLLLPLSLLDAAVVDLALVVSRQGEFYRGHTVLTTAMAYNNARLLARPDSDWLRPATEDEAP